LSSIAEYKARVATSLGRQREQARMFVSGAEIVVGATAGGYLAAQWPTVGGVPTDAAVGIASLVGGIAMKQKDLTCIGLGLLAGYAHDWGANMAEANPLPFGVYAGGKGE
jgi:hypothetical protein